MELRKFIQTTIREYLNENLNKSEIDSIVKYHIENDTPTKTYLDSNNIDIYNYFKNKLIELNTLRDKNKIMIYRILDDSTFINKLKNSNEIKLGIYWFYNKQSVIDNFNYGDTNILLTGEINTGSIDFSLTNELNTFGDWVYEDEIRLINGKEILIKGIHRNGKKIKFDENIKFFS